VPDYFEERRVVPQKAGSSERLSFLWFVSLDKQRNEQFKQKNQKEKGLTIID